MFKEKRETRTFLLQFKIWSQFPSHLKWFSSDGARSKTHEAWKKKNQKFSSSENLASLNVARKNDIFGTTFKPVSVCWKLNKF